MELKVYQNKEFGKVRAINRNGEPWFVAKDVCEILDISKYRDAVARLDEDERGSVLVDTLGGKQEMASINESGLYALIVRSRKPEARKFRKWVTCEVLPSIRKNGGYIANQENLSDEEIFAKALIAAQNIINSKEKMIEELRPKADFYDQVAGCQDAIDFGSAVKVLNIPGLGRNRLFEILRNKRILMNNNQPYQKYIDAGYFRTVEQKYNTKKGETHISIKTLVYQKGLNFIRKLVS